MVSLGGVYAPSPNSKQSKLPIALENMTQNQSQINTIALHLDNDYAGRNAASAIATQLEEKYVIRDEPPAYGKDCNDYLQHMIRQKPSRQMGREQPENTAAYDNIKAVEINGKDMHKSEFYAQFDRG